MPRLAALIVLVLFLGCQPAEPDPSTIASQRMTKIVSLAQQTASVPQHRELLAEGSIFVNIEGLDMPCVGVRVPTPDRSNRILVSFTQEWFETHSDEEVAEAVNADLGRVLGDLELGE